MVPEQEIDVAIAIVDDIQAERDEVNSKEQQLLTKMDMNTVLLAEVNATKRLRAMIRVYR